IACPRRIRAVRTAHPTRAHEHHAALDCYRDPDRPVTRGRLPAVFDEALSRSKLEAIVSVGLWVPVGAGHARDGLRGHGTRRPPAPTENVMTRKINDIRVV